MRPRWGPVERSTAIAGKVIPRLRLNPGAPLPMLLCSAATVRATPNDTPWFTERSTRMKSTSEVPNSIHVSVTSPAGPTATRAPWTPVLAPAWYQATATGEVQVSPPSNERWNRMLSAPAAVRVV